MRFLIYIILVLFAFCSNERKTATKNVSKKNISKEVLNKYDTIIGGLRKNYILNVLSYDEKDREPILKFYSKTKPDFRADSIIYFGSVKSFFASDSTIIDYLTSFIGDTTKCDWIYSPNPYSSKIKNWELHFSKEQGALVLMHDYLSQLVKNKRVITTSPSEIELILSLHSKEILSE